MPSFGDGRSTSRLPDIWERQEIIAHTECLSVRPKHRTGRNLMPGVSDPRKLSRRVSVSDEKTWNPIALSGDLLVVRNDREAACIRLPVGK